MILAFLCKYRGLDIEEALATVRTVRQCANPRPEFMAALHLFADRVGPARDDLFEGSAAEAKVDEPIAEDETSVSEAAADEPIVYDVSSSSDSHASVLHTVRELRGSSLHLKSFCSAHKLAARVHPRLALVQLSYSQRESNLANKAVQECRGLILEKGTWRVVAMPFTKFFNADEPAATADRQAFDWQSARVYEKLDGSLMTLYFYEDQWHVASMRVPDAGGEVPGCGGGTFANLFWATFNSSGYKLPAASARGRCFVFELCLPAHTIVVRHTAPSLHLIGARDIQTLEELPIEIVAAELGWQTPGELPPPTGAGADGTARGHCLESVKAAARALNPVEHEGYVCVDASFRRLKVKSPAYVALHHIGEGGLAAHLSDSVNQGRAGRAAADSHMMLRRRMLEVARCREGDEFLAYFPALRATYDAAVASLKQLSCVRGDEWARVAPIAEVEAAIDSPTVTVMTTSAVATIAAAALAGRRVLITLVGLPGSGKSSFARQLSGEVSSASCSSSSRLDIVCQDECGTRQLCLARARDALRRGHSVVIDRCNVDAPQRLDWVSLGREYNCIIVAVFLHVPSDECARRVMRRARHPTLPPSEKAGSIVRRFASELRKPEPSEGFDVALEATSTDEADEIAASLAGAIAPSDNSAGEAISPTGMEAPGAVMDTDEDVESALDLTLTERRRKKAADMKSRRGKRDVKFAMLEVQP